MENVLTPDQLDIHALRILIAHPGIAVMSSNRVYYRSKSVVNAVMTRIVNLMAMAT